MSKLRSRSHRKWGHYQGFGTDEIAALPSAREGDPNDVLPGARPYHTSASCGARSIHWHGGPSRGKHRGTGPALHIQQNRVNPLGHAIGAIFYGRLLELGELLNQLRSSMDKARLHRILRSD